MIIPAFSRFTLLDKDRIGDNSGRNKMPLFSNVSDPFFRKRRQNIRI